MTYDDLVYLKYLLAEFKEMTGHEAPEIVSVIEEIFDENVTLPKKKMN